MKRFLMLADDFTGSGDSGVQMVKNGIETHIVFDAVDLNPEYSYVVDTETRNVSEKEAYDKVKGILDQLKDQTFDHYYKKIDSTLRGNISEELRAVSELLQPDLIVFNPANPDAGRTVKNEILKLNGVRICETDIMNDPLSLVKEDNIRKYMESSFYEEVQHISLECIHEDAIELTGAKILTFDFMENQDCDKVLTFLLRQNKKILWVGSAGMANRLFRILRDAKPVLGLAGSISKVTRQQVEYAVSQGAVRVKLDIAALIKGEMLDKTADEVKLFLQQKNDVIVVTAESHEDYLQTIRTGEQFGMNRSEVAQYTQKQLGKLSKIILSECELCGLFLTGGDTAISVAAANQATGARIVKEVLPVIPLLQLDGGLYPGLKCVVKAGAMGEQHAIAEAIRFLKQDQ